MLRRLVHPEPALAALLWGGVFTAVKFGLQSIPTLSFATLRLLLAGCLFLLIAGRPPWKSLSGPVWNRLILTGLAQTVFQILLLQGLQRTSVSASAILLATAPLLTAVWLALRREHRQSGRQWVGLAAGFVGVALVVRADGTDLAGSATLGNLMAFGARVAWAWYSLALRPVVAALGPVRAATATVVFAALAFTPFAVPELLTVDWARVSWPAWAGLGYGATAGLVVATALWVRSLERWGTQLTMNYGYLEPVAAVIIAAVLLGESLSPLQVIGGGFALVGVWLASRT